ncbi:MAG: LPS export ABC transporter periplasmic protein LptC [Thermodesulfobacteriota bacterium]
MLTRQKIRIILLGLILLFSLGVGITIFTHQRLDEREEIIEDITVEADAALNQFTYTQIEDGEPKWDIEAERGTHDAKANITNLVDIKAEFFGDTPNGSITMTANTAEAMLDSETIVARGDVVVTTASGYQLRTTELEYSKQNIEKADTSRDSNVDGVIHSREIVEFEGDKLRIQGLGMTYQIGPRFLQIHNEVSAHILPHSESDSRDMSNVAAQDKQ